MRTFLTRALGALFLGGLLAAGVGATAAAASPAAAPVHSSHAQSMDWWY